MGFDNTLLFEDNWESIVEETVTVSYNHPSVVFYSIGNEISDYGTASGSRRVRKILQKLRGLDDTRLT